MAEVRKKMEEELEAINNSLDNSKAGVSTVSITSMIERLRVDKQNYRMAILLHFCSK